MMEVEVVKGDVKRATQEYAGFAAIERLFFIAEHSEKARLEAVELLLERCVEMKNTQHYRMVFEKFPSEVVGVQMDQDWLRTTEAENQTQLVCLQRDLDVALQNVIKEKIRMHLNDIGDYYYKLGNYKEALTSFLRCRDYSMNNTHELSSIRKIIALSIPTRNSNHLQVYSNKSKAILGKQAPDDPLHEEKIACCLGIGYMFQKQYDLAIEKFMCVTLRLGNNLNDVIILKDVALYGGLCALAAYDRHKLQSEVMGHDTFRPVLESNPVMLDLISSLLNSNYARLAECLEEVRKKCQLDIYLRSSTTSMCHNIRVRSFEQYVTAFSVVDMPKMADTFGMSVEALESELSSLILNGTIVGKMDMETKSLRLSPPDSRQAAIGTALRFGREFEKGVALSLLGCRLESKNFVHKPARIAIGKDGRNKKQAKVPTLTSEDDDEDFVMDEMSDTESDPIANNRPPPETV